MFPLHQQIAMLFKCNERRRQLLYRTNRAESHEELQDIFDGNAYKGLKTILYQNPYDIAIGLCVDGFAPFKRNGRSMTLIMAVIYNFPPEIRYH